MDELTVHCCDPRERAGEIKDLFAQCGQSDFAPYFERAYHARAEAGLRSWIGVADGNVVSHISVTPVEFGNGEYTLRGGILGDLQIAEGHRDFWTPVRLLRTMVADIKRQEEIDFLLTTTTDEAEGIFKAGGFKVFGQLRRFVLPLFGPYVLWSRVRAGARSPLADQLPLGADEVGQLLPTLTSNGAWRPLASPGFYATRVPKDGFVDGTWVTYADRTGNRNAKRWALVGHHESRPESAVSDAFWDGDEAGLGEVLFAAARWSKDERCTRMSISILDDTVAARELVRCGFFPRSIRSRVLLQRIRGGELPGLKNWFLPGLAMSGW